MNMQEFHLPRNKEIPNIGLFLEQTVRYINATLAPLGEEEITPSMVSNYVKTGLLPKPEKKLYYPPHIRILFYIATMKNVASLEDAALFAGMKEEEYDRFCARFEDCLFAALPQEEGGAASREQIVEQMISASVSKILLDRTIAAHRSILPQKDEKEKKKEKKEKKKK